LAASRNPTLPALQDLVDWSNWEPLLTDVGYVVHLAGVAHKGAAVSDEMYDRINHVAVADLTATNRALLGSRSRWKCGRP